MTDYMKEAERLLAEHEQAAGLCSYADCQTTRAALLAHIQRGVVPMKLNVGFYTLVAEKPIAEHDLPEWRHMYRIVADGNGRVLGYISDPSMLAAAAPDHFRDAAIEKAWERFEAELQRGQVKGDAAEMVAAPAECRTCSGHGMVGGLLPNGVGYQADPCPDCTAPAPEEVPMPEAGQSADEARVAWRNKLKAHHTHDFGRGAELHPDVIADAMRVGEAAGYARVLEWAVSRWKSEVENRPLENKNRRPLDDVWRQVVRFAGGDPDALLGPSHDAALRGEVKP